MVTFYISAKPEAVKKFFYDLDKRGIESGNMLPEKMRKNYISPSCLWSYESKGDKHQINYMGFPFGSYLFYLLFKMALKTKYNETCKRINKSEFNGQ